VHAGGEEYVIGTGAKDFKANARPDFFYNSPDLPPHEQVVRIVLWLAGNATGREMFSGEPLRHLYGGTIEATLFAEGRFTPLTDITFLFWHVVTDLEGKDFRVTPMATFRSTVMSRMLSSYTRVESASTKGADQPTKRFMSPHMLTRVASHLRFRRFCPVSLSTTAIASAVGLSEMGQSGAV